MRIPIWQIDAFATRVFEGNPAAVCLLESWLDDATLQAVAAENNLSETAFVVAEGDDFHVRWFTPCAEVDLCGHATLASAHVIFGRDASRESISFASRSGPLRVRRVRSESERERIELDFPQQPATAREPSEALLRVFGDDPARARASVSACASNSRDWLVELEDEASVADFEPDNSLIAALELPALCITARASEASGDDFVSRFFAPRLAVPEDPVTGSAHCMLAPWWAERLGKTELRARQLSSRGGQVDCVVLGDRVLLRGETQLYLEGHIQIPAQATRVRD